MSSNNKVAPAIIVHGGAFDFHSVLQNVIAERKAGIQAAVRAGYEALVNTDNPVDAVETAIKVMELDPVFNAGKLSDPCLAPCREHLSLIIYLVWNVTCVTSNRKRSLSCEKWGSRNGCYNHSRL